MASLKEYQMMFQLQAKLNSGFSGTMKSAQTELLTLQQRVQDLSRIQSDIAAYEKQQAAVEATRQKLSTLQQQYDNIQKEIQETEGFSSSLENQLLSKQQQIDKTSASLEKQTGKLDAMGAALENAGVDTGNLSSESSRLATEIEGVKTEEEAVAEKANNMGTSGAEAIDTLASALAAAGIVKMLKEIGEAYMTCVTNAADFEETMSTVEALSGASAAEMSALSEEAKALGASTKFTATEAAEAMTYMGMAGWGAQDMLNGMNGVLSLAAASGEDLARTSDIVTDNLTAFGLTAADTAHFSDVLAAAATNSNTDVSTMGETFKQSASIAGALGYSVDDVAVAVGLMANAGVKGSIAGTALKNTFNGLLEGATLTGEAFGEYEFSALQADGTMKSFGATIDELRYYFGQMTEAERVNNAMAIAGKRSYNGLLAILNATDEDYASLTDNIKNCSGAAQNMAKIKMNNMNGQLTLMKSAWDAVTISIGEQFLPEMTSLYEVGTDVLTWVNDMIQENPQLVSGFTAFIGVVGAATAGITGFAAAAKVVKALDLASMFTGPAAAIIGLTAVAAAQIAAVQTDLDNLVGGYHAAAEEYKTSAEEHQNNLDAIDTEAESTQGLVTQLRGLAEQSERTATEKSEMAEIVNQLNTAIPDLNLAYDAESDTLTGLTGSVEEYVSALYEAQKYQENVARAIELKEQIAELDEQLQAAKATAESTAATNKTFIDFATLGSGLDVMSAANERALMYTGETSAAVEELQGAYDAAQAELAEVESELDNYNAAQEEAAQATGGAIDYTQELIAAQDELRAKYDEVYLEALDSYRGQFSLMEEAAEVTTTSSSELLGNIDSQIGYWADYNTNLQTVMDNIASMASQGVDTSNIQAYLDAINDGSPEAAGAIAGLASASQEDLATIGESYGDLQTKQGETAQTTAELETEFAAALATMRGDMEGFVAAMNLSGEASSAASSTASSYINTFISYASQAYSAGQQMARNAVAGMRSVTGGAMPGYATGTTSAERGFAWVGENGPELMFFNGGEQILNAQQSAAFQKEHHASLLAPAETARPEAASSSATKIVAPYSPVYNISGVDRADDLESVLRSHDEFFREYIQDVIEDAEADAARRRF